MRYTFLSFLLPFCLLASLESAFAADTQLESSDRKQKSSQLKSFDVVSRNLVAQQVNLIARIQQALSEPDSNRMRAVGGQLITHTVVVESFLKRQYSHPQALCGQNQAQNTSVDSIPPFNPSNLKIYCSLYNSTQELSKLTPILDRLLSRRGELAIVRELPLVSGEKQSDLVLPMSPVSRPNLYKRAIPYAILEPAVEQSPSLFIGKRKKSAIANYTPPVQPAIKPPSAALTTLENAEKFLSKAISVFPSTNQFQNPHKVRAELDHLSYDVDLLQKQTYKKLLSMPNTGIFRVLPHQAYLRPLNTVKNRSQKDILGRYPFPVLAKPEGNFKPNLPLQIVKEKFQLLSQGVDYGFIADVGQISLEKLDASLEAIDADKRDLFINYQPPKKLDALLVEKRKITTGKQKITVDNQFAFNQVDAKLNHTYLVRNLQFQLPEIITNNQVVSKKQRRYIEQLLQMPSSDVIVAFKPVRRHSDGSYTILWRVLQQFKDPKIEDLEDYLKYQK
ncbi:hypothetical protein Riv7116_0281 [Rivularia sp. PCC 7116]|uniref:hypothetical protein n=1 Tax=Rivularia sp. PCC 7116 TaxID=373994 RepID=UPI00029F356E|nr:hypothetical protein [Rivularia sp. PCC 7116]AFY52885.1 hypothetical protein Riv7116_0281 [Rivularia sp. PCC 7116]